MPKKLKRDLNFLSATATLATYSTIVDTETANTAMYLRSLVVPSERFGSVPAEKATRETTISS